MEENERLAILETKMEEVESQNERILDTLTTIKSDLARYKGFIGGIIFVGSCLVTLLTFAKDFIISKLT